MLIHNIVIINNQHIKGQHYSRDGRGDSSEVVRVRTITLQDMVGGVVVGRLHIQDWQTVNLMLVRPEV